MQATKIHKEATNLAYLNIGDVAFLSHKGKAWTVLGSCVSICMFSKIYRYTVVCHGQLPERLMGHDQHCYDTCPSSCTRGRTCVQEHKYLDQVIPYMVSWFDKQGVMTNQVGAVIVGGASIVESLSLRNSVGNKNIEASIRLLNKSGIKIVASETGGSRSRQLHIDNDKGIISINKKPFYNLWGEK